MALFLMNLRRIVAGGRRRGRLALQTVDWVRAQPLKARFYHCGSLAQFAAICYLM